MHTAWGYRGLVSDRELNRKTDWVLASPADAGSNGRRAVFLRRLAKDTESAPARGYTTAQTKSTPGDRANDHRAEVNRPTQLRPKLVSSRRVSRMEPALNRLPIPNVEHLDCVVVEALVAALGGVAG